MCLLDHVDIIAAIAHGHRQMCGFFLDPPDNFFFVLGSASIANSGVERDIRWNALLSIEHEYFCIFVAGDVEESIAPFLIVVLVIFGDVDSSEALVDEAARTTDRLGCLLLVSSQNVEHHT